MTQLEAPPQHQCVSLKWGRVLRFPTPPPTLPLKFWPRDITHLKRRPFDISPRSHPVKLKNFTPYFYQYICPPPVSMNWMTLRKLACLQCSPPSRRTTRRKRSSWRTSSMLATSRLQPSPSSGGEADLFSAGDIKAAAIAFIRR